MEAAGGALRQQINDAAVVHLACHGVIDKHGNSSLLLGGVAELHKMTRDNFDLLRGGPVVVLSACNVGGFGSARAPAEQFGFPAVLLASGARAVLGPLWPVPDSAGTVEFMLDYHRNLQVLPSNQALARSVESAARQQRSLLTWAAFTHFGTAVLR
jgi:CHAT domain-containing protein